MLRNNIILKHARDIENNIAHSRVLVILLDETEMLLNYR